jgi:hypothetical protein
MGKTSTSFEVGQSGNPLGRPKDTRSMAWLISEITDLEDERGVTWGEKIAFRVIEALIQGEVRLGTGRTLELNVSQWLDLLKWFHHHVDGSMTVTEVRQR